MFERLHTNYPLARGKEKQKETNKVKTTTLFGGGGEVENERTKSGKEIKLNGND